MSIKNLSSPAEMIIIRKVNADNLVGEFDVISSAIDKYHIVSVETVFDGVIIRPVADNNGYFRHQTSDQLYDHLKGTVEASELTQLGLTLTDADGNLPDLDLDAGNVYIWEFNFQGLVPAIDLGWTETLKQNGIDFPKNRDEGIDSVKFAELLMSSGLVCNEEVTWVTFHSAYDLGYLLKMLSGKALPDDLPQFLRLLKIFFGADVFDLKHLMKHCEGLHGGLEQVAKTLKVEPAAGKAQLAGANSLLTWNVFQKMKELCGGEPEKFGCGIYGLELA